MKYKNGGKDCQKNIGGLYNGGTDPGGSGKSTVEQDILQDCLKQHKDKNRADGRTNRMKKLLLYQASGKNDQHPGQGKPHTGKQNAAGGIRSGDLKQLIPRFYAGKGTSPEKIAEYSGQADN